MNRYQMNRLFWAFFHDFILSEDAKQAVKFVELFTLEQVILGSAALHSFNLQIGFHQVKFEHQPFGDPNFLADGSFSVLDFKASRMGSYVFTELLQGKDLDSISYLYKLRLHTQCNYVAYDSCGGVKDFHAPLALIFCGSVETVMENQIDAIIAQRQDLFPLLAEPLSLTATDDSFANSQAFQNACDDLPNLNSLVVEQGWPIVEVLQALTP